MVSTRAKQYSLSCQRNTRKQKRPKLVPLLTSKPEPVLRSKREPLLQTMTSQHHRSQQIASQPSNIVPSPNNGFTNHENTNAPTNAIVSEAPNTESGAIPSNSQVQQLLQLFQQAAAVNSNHGNVPQPTGSGLTIPNLHNQPITSGLPVATVPQQPFRSVNSFPQQLLQHQLPPNPYTGYFMNQGQANNSYGSLPVPNPSGTLITAPYSNLPSYSNNQLTNSSQTGIAYGNNSRDLPNDVYMRKLGDQKFRVIESIHGVIDKNIVIIVDKLFKGKLLSEDELGKISKEEQERDDGRYFLSPRRSPSTKRYRYGGYNYKG